MARPALSTLLRFHPFLIGMTEQIMHHANHIIEGVIRISTRQHCSEAAAWAWSFPSQQRRAWVQLLRVQVRQRMIRS